MQWTKLKFKNWRAFRLVFYGGGVHQKHTQRNARSVTKTQKIAKNSKKYIHVMTFASLGGAGLSEWRHRIDWQCKHTKKRLKGKEFVHPEVHKVLLQTLYTFKGGAAALAEGPTTRAQCSQNECLPRSSCFEKGRLGQGKSGCWGLAAEGYRLPSFRGQRTP